MSELLFNPFEDRLSRDIRNTLSKDFASGVETGNSDQLTRTIEHFKEQQFASCYTDYISDRNERYQKGLTAIMGKLTDPIEQAVILWNLGLFFEVHEVLEHAWYSAEGELKATLQALIRAAGVYIKKEYGFIDSALRIAKKSVVVLENNTTLLNNYFLAQELILALKDKDLANKPAPSLTIPT